MAEHLPGDAASLEQKAEEQKRLTVLSPDAAGRWAALAASMPCDSVKFLTRAIILSPGDFRLYVNLSNRYLASGEARRIWGPLRAAAILFPGLARAYEYLGVSIPVSVTGGDRRRLRTWSWIWGGAAQAGVVAAARLIDLDRLEAASALLKEVIFSDALSSEAWRQCALLEQKKARDKLARAAFRRAVLTAPNICDGYIAASAFLIDQREFAFAAHQAEGDVLPDGEGIEQGTALEEHAELGEEGVAVAGCGVFTVYGYFTGTRCNEAKHAFQRDGFARTRTADDDHALAFGDVEVHAAQDVVGAEGFFDVLEGDHVSINL